MIEADWYELAQGPELLQGDILLRCSVAVPSDPLTWPVPANGGMAVRIKLIDLVVMTQSCDLVNEKVEEVLLARLVPWPIVVRDEVQKGNLAIRGSKFRKMLVDGNVPSLSLLHKREQEPSLAWSVVDFHKLYTLARAFLRQFAAAAGPRLRLRSPYREQLAQAFARYFMRVGLPHDAKEFEKEGDVKIG